jgi:hypothetical protein
MQVSVLDGAVSLIRSCMSIFHSTFPRSDPNLMIYFEQKQPDEVLRLSLPIDYSYGANHFHRSVHNSV